LITFSFQTIYGPEKFSLKSSHIEIRIFQTTSDGEIIKTKIAYL